MLVTVGQVVLVVVKNTMQMAIAAVAKAVSTAVAVIVVVIVVMSRDGSVHSYGNKSTSSVCTRHGRPFFCWYPRNDSTYTAFWKAHGGEVNPLVKTGHKKGNYTVFHLRCGDIMNEHNTMYMPPPDSCVKKAAAGVNTTNLIFMTGGHHSTPRADRRCARFMKRYTAIIQAAHPGASLTISQGGTQKNDWLVLHNAKSVVALITSSFVFSAKAHDLSALKMLSYLERDVPWWINC